MPKKSLLKSTIYPQASPKKWLIFVNQWQSKIDPVFAGRLAALACHYQRKITIVSGFRTYKEQRYHYKICHKRGALKPGTSWHEYGGAVDTNTQWLCRLNNCHLSKQHLLRKYGLCKPLTYGNRFSPPENWHLQPIETARSQSQKSKRRFYRAYKLK